MIELLKIENSKEYDDFLQSHERCNFLQSLSWGKVKDDNWKNEVIIIRDNNKIVASLSIHIRNIPIFGNFMYAPRGPVCDIHNKEVLSELRRGISEVAKKYKAFVFIMEPDIRSDDIEFREIIETLNFKIKDTAKDFDEEINPRYVFKLSIKGKTEEQVMEEFHQKTRYNIRLATKKGVKIKEGNREDLKDFHKIMIETGERDKFTIRSLKYFEKIYDCMQPGHVKLLMAYHENIPIAGILLLIYGNKSCYLYGASSNSYRNLMPNYLLQWEGIKDAILAKRDVYDFRGVSGVVDENHPQYGLYRFKKGFGAEFVEYIGEIYIPFRPIVYRAYKMVDKIRRKFI